MPIDIWQLLEGHCQWRNWITKDFGKSWLHW